MSNAIILRDYQIRFISDISKAHKDGHDGIIGQMPTGSGKTVCFARIAKAFSEHGGRVLIVVHRDELIDQTCKKLDFFGLEYGIIAAKKGKNKKPLAKIQVGMVQTLARRLEKLKNLNAGKLTVKFHYIIFDEAHLSASASYRKIIEFYPNAKRLGLSATPWRLDGQGLKHIGTTIVKGPSVKQLVESGSLVPFTMFAVPVADLSGIKIIRGDYDPIEQSARFKKANVVGDVIKHFSRLCKLSDTRYRSTIGFFTSIEHSKRVCDKFNEVGIIAEHIDGETPKEDRKKVLDNLALGKTTVVCNYGCLTEGFDCERVSCIIVCRKTKSAALFRQMCGRGLRTHNHSGKRDCVIIDHGMNGINHGNLDYEYPFSLEGKKRTGSGERLAKICKQCSAYCEINAEECHVCGYSFVITEQKERKIKEIEAELAMLPSGFSPATSETSIKKFHNRRLSSDDFNDWFNDNGFGK
jgi:superfamily II DNA or RNA helicase